MSAYCTCLQCCACGRLCSFLCITCDGKPLLAIGYARVYEDPPSLTGAAFYKDYQAAVNALSSAQQELFYTLYEDWARRSGDHNITDDTCRCLTFVDMARELA